MSLFVYLDRLPVDVLRSPESEVQQACADRFVGEPIDQDKAARVAVLLVGIEGDYLIEIEIAYADFVQMQRLRREMLERVDVDLVLRRRDRHADCFGSDLEQIRPSGKHLIPAHPNQR